MASALRQVKVKFDGSANGLIKAAAAGARAIGSLKNKVDGAGKSAGSRMAAKFTDTFASIASKLPGLPASMASSPGVGMAATAMAGVMAPILIAGVSSAILLGAGAGIIGLGALLLKDNPKIQAGWSKLVSKAKATFTAAAEPMIGPFVAAMERFGKLVDRIAPDLKKMFAAVAPTIEPLADALAQFVENAMPGLVAAVSASAPVLLALADSMPGLGSAVSSFFQSIADSGPGAVLFITGFIAVLGALLRFWGNGIEVWSKGLVKLVDAFNFLKRMAIMSLTSLALTGLAMLGQLIGGAAKAFSWVPGIGPKLANAATEFTKFKDKANRELNAIRDRTVNVTITTSRVYKEVDLTARSRGESRTGRAVGGPVASGRSYLVGERGPEILNMGRQSGHITPNGALGGDTLVFVTIDGEQLQGRITRTVREDKRQTKRSVLAGAGAR